MSSTKAAQAQIKARLCVDLPVGATIHFQYISTGGGTTCYAILLMRDGELINASRDIAHVTGLVEHRTIQGVYAPKYAWSGVEGVTSLLSQTLYDDTTSLVGHLIPFTWVETAS